MKIILPSSFSGPEKIPFIIGLSRTGILPAEAIISILLANPASP